METLPFDGVTYDPADSGPLGAQLAAVHLCLARGGWYTIREIQDWLVGCKVYAEPQSISARIRDLRKTKFGRRKINRRLREPRVSEYHMEPREELL